MIINQQKIEGILNETQKRIIQEKNLSHVDTGVKFEEYVVIIIEDICKEILKNEGTKISVEQTGTQSFPDIILGDIYGIEVKYTKSNRWQSTGNSIFEGTSRKEVAGQVYMFFGKKLDNQIDVKWKNYEDSLVDIKVTHSPRFFIDMEIESDDTILSKINTPYNTFRTLDPKEKAKLLKEFVRRSLNEGESLWWLDETQDESSYPKIKDFRILEPYQKRYFLVEAAVLFPEIFSKQLDKYFNISIYLLQEYQIVSSSLRDIFSAGGKVDFVMDGTNYKVPKIYNILQEYANEIKSVITQTNNSKLVEYWSVHNVLEVNDINKFDQWKKLLNQLSSSLPEGVSATDIFEKGLSS